MNNRVMQASLIFLYCMVAVILSFTLVLIPQADLISPLMAGLVIIAIGCIYTIVRIAKKHRALKQVAAVLILLCVLVGPVSAVDGSLRPYDIDKSRDIWMAEDPTSYIIPDNKIVQEYADRLYLDVDGWIRYVDEFSVSAQLLDGTKLYSNKVFRNAYQWDYEQFGSGNFAVGADNDYWVNPDYYLNNGLQGDCEDVAIAIASMMQTGNISIRVNDTLVPTKINASVNVGYYHGYRHAWVEYEIYDRTFVYSSTEFEQRPFRAIDSFYTWYTVTDLFFSEVVL